MTIGQDVRSAIRSLRRSPGFTAMALATFALGIAANAGIFSVVDAVLWRPLPYPDAGRLVRLGDRSPNAEPDNIGYETFEDVRDDNRTFSRMAVIRSWYPTLSAPDGGQRLPALRVTPDYFAMLGARPALGRFIAKDDDNPDAWKVVLLSDALWRSRFGADPAIVGRSVRLNGEDFRVVGVLPKEFRDLLSARYYQDAQLWAPVGYRRGLSVRLPELRAPQGHRSAGSRRVHRPGRGGPGSDPRPAGRAVSPRLPGRGVHGNAALE